VSGAVLNPLISMAVAMVKRRLSRAA
jgi:hypothetical protein